MTSFHSCEKERSEFWDNPVQYGYEHERFDATPVGCPDRYGDRRLLPISSHRCSEAFVWQVSGHQHTCSTSPNSFTPSEGVTNGLYRLLYPTIIRDLDVSSQRTTSFHTCERERSRGWEGWREREELGRNGEEDGRL